MKAPIFCGDDLLLAELPEDTRVIAPPPPDDLPGPAPGILLQALDSPVDSPPLSELVDSSSRVVIAFDDNALPLPAMRRELRPLAIRAILERLTSAGVQQRNVRLICAQGLHRKLTDPELTRLVGRDVFHRFTVGNHDAEDPDQLVSLGATEEGEEVEVNRAVTHCDLLIYVNINWTQMNGGWKSVVVGLGSYSCISQHHNPQVLTHSRSPMEPGQSAMHQMYERMGRLVEQQARCVTLEMVIDSRLWWGPWKGMTLDPSLSRLPLMARASRHLPLLARDLMRRAFTADYGLRAANFGQLDAVHRRTLSILDESPCVTVRGQSDALLLGVVDLSPYSVGGYPNPILVANLGLGYLFNLHQGRPLVKEGGTVILCNPCRARFHPRHHPSYERFFEQALRETTDAAQLHEFHEQAYAQDEGFRQAYRRGYAYHGVHPFFTWFWCCHARAHVGRVIVAGAKEPWAVQRLGFEPAATVEQALDMAREGHPGGMSLTYQMVPPAFVCKVEE